MKLSELFSAFADALREASPRRTVSIVIQEYDPTYGPRESTQEIEVIDFDQLMRAIDDFGRQLRERGN